MAVHAREPAVIEERCIDNPWELLLYLVVAPLAWYAYMCWCNRREDL